MFIFRMLTPLFFFSTLLAQEIYFPSDDEQSSTSNITKLLELKRGTDSYEYLVDSVISRGILKLTLALDRATLSNSGQSSDNIVFSPISVAGNCLSLYLNVYVRHVCSLRILKTLDRLVTRKDKRTVTLML